MIHAQTVLTFETFATFTINAGANVDGNGEYITVTIDYSGVCGAESYAWTADGQATIEKDKNQGTIALTDTSVPENFLGLFDTG